MKTYHTDHAVITVPIILTYTHLHKHQLEFIFCPIRCAQPKENTQVTMYIENKSIGHKLTILMM